MTTFARPLLVGLLITNLVACSIMQTVRDLPPGQIRPSNQVLKNVNKGDQVKVWTKSGDIMELTMISVDEVMLNGTDAGQPVQIPRDQITRLDVKKFSIVATVLVGFVALVIVAFLSLAAE